MKSSIFDEDEKLLREIYMWGLRQTIKRLHFLCNHYFFAHNTNFRFVHIVGQNPLHPRLASKPPGRWPKITYLQIIKLRRDPLHVCLNSPHLSVISVSAGCSVCASIGWQLEERAGLVVSLWVRTECEGWRLKGCSIASAGLIPPSSQRCAVRYDAMPFDECTTWDWQHSSLDPRYVMCRMLLHSWD